MPAGAEQAVRAVVHGRVQGVGFRWSALREARRLGLRGTVGNRGDGTVEVVAEGDATAVDIFLAWLRRGPPGAHVTDVTVDPLPVTGRFGSFEIDY